MKIRSISLVAVTCLLAACGGGEEQQAQTAPALVIGGKDASSEAMSLYQMPTPNELFAIVRELNGKGDKNAMSPTPNADRFATLPGRALNFGAYATDMVYASNFKLTSEVVRYYLACRKLGDQLGLSASFSGDVQQRLEKNMTHGDSLDVLTNDAYYAAYEKLQSEQMGPTLCLVLAGGWLESMHLVMGQLQAFDEKDPLVARIAEQKVSLEQLIEMMGTFENDPNVSPTRVKLMGVRDIFDQLNVTRTPHQGASPSGRMVLGDDVSMALTADKFNELKTTVEALRAAAIKPEDSTPNS